MEEIIRVLQINSGSRDFGGVSAFLYNMYSNIEKTRVQFDFLSPFRSTYELYKDEIISSGGRVLEFGINGNSIMQKIRLYCSVLSFLKQHKYDIVHINSGNFFFNLIVSEAAKKASVPVRIVHSHNAGNISRSIIKRKLMNLLKNRLAKNANVMFACSKIAAEYMFPVTAIKHQRVSIIPNGINADDYAYDDSVRQEVRNELGIGDRFAVGNVGRFMPQKNHMFIVEVFSELMKKIPNSVLLLVGQGNLEQQIHQNVLDKGIESNVFFLGQRSDANRIYQAMDVFFLPSLYEGFGIVNIEAQCSGLMCVVSEAIPKEANVTGDMERLSLDATVSQWVDSLVSAANLVRTDKSELIKKAGYDVKTVANDLQKRYEYYMCKVLNSTDGESHMKKTF